jgi:putative hydrolase
MAVKNSICLEVSTRKGHGMTNGHVVRMARESKASLVLNTDAHEPQDIVGIDYALKIAAGAGMTVPEIEIMFRNSGLLVEKALQAR